MRAETNQSDTNAAATLEASRYRDHERDRPSALSAPDSRLCRWVRRSRPVESPERRRRRDILWGGRAFAADRSRGGKHEDDQQHDCGDVGKGDLVTLDG